MPDQQPLLRIERTDDGLRLHGEIDGSSADELANLLDPLPGTGDVVVDLADVGFIDSSGLRVLIDAHQRAERSNRLVVLAHPSAVVRRLLDITGLTDYLRIEPAAS
jgi:anti-sigma B factor antagonist